MKLTNYKKGFNDLFGCSIHGTIYMTFDEYEKVINYLVKNEDKLYLNGETLDDDLSSKIWTDKGFLISLRTTATELLVKHFKLTNYKQGNYQLYILN